MLRNWILGLLEFFYQPFRKVMPWQTFRYAACGGGNTLLDIFMYFVAYNFILHKQVVHIPVLGAVSPHIAAFLIAFAISFPTGYLLNRYIVFSGSVLKGSVQLFRYFLLVMICLGLNYVFIKIFVERFHLFPTVSKALTTVIVVSFSYVTQKNFTFKAEPRPQV